jgi:hypothetical protein
MRKENLKSVAAGALAFVVAVPVFAQSRGDYRNNNNDNRDYNRNDTQSSRSYRENERITMQGKVTSFTHERDGYRVQLDRGRESYWVPQSYFRNRAPRVGISVVFGGVWRGGSVIVDDVNWPEEGYRGRAYDQQFVRGTVERVDRRDGLVWLREARTGRSISVDLRGNQERRLRRGDYVELTGSWQRDGVFTAYRIDGIR